MVDAISPKGHLSVAQAARRLGVSVSRVNHLIAAGDLRSSRLGALTIIPEQEVERRIALHPAPGRRLTPSNAWALLSMASGEPAPWLKPDARYRLRMLLDRRSLMGLQSKLVARGTWHGLRAHPSLLGAIRDDHALMLTGVAAAGKMRLGIIAGESVDAYVAEPDFPGVLVKYGLKPSQDPNVVLRSVQPFSPLWPPGHLAPKAAVALDLLEADDPRPRQVGRELLERLKT